MGESVCSGTVGCCVDTEVPISCQGNSLKVNVGNTCAAEVVKTVKDCAKQVDEYSGKIMGCKGKSISGGGMKQGCYPSCAQKESYVLCKDSEYFVKDGKISALRTYVKYGCAADGIGYEQLNSVAGCPKGYGCAKEKGDSACVLLK